MTKKSGVVNVHGMYAHDMHRVMFLIRLPGVLIVTCPVPQHYWVKR